MKIDVIILANTTSLEKYGMTCRTINSLRWADSYDYDIILVESNKDYLEQGFVYEGIANEIVVPDEPFGYNRFLNHGLKVRERKSDWVIVANNDLIFTQYWMENLLEWQGENPEFKSLCPWEPTWHSGPRKMDEFVDFHAGYRTSFEIAGWCIVMHDDVINECKLFDPDFEFWYQDNDYALTLQKFNIKHALVTNAKVYHMISGSHDTLAADDKHRMTDGQINVLTSKWGPNV